MTIYKRRGRPGMGSPSQTRKEPTPPTPRLGPLASRTVTRQKFLLL